MHLIHLGKSQASDACHDSPANNFECGQTIVLDLQIAGFVYKIEQYLAAGRSPFLQCLVNDALHRSINKDFLEVKVFSFVSLGLKKHGSQSKNCSAGLFFLGNGQNLVHRKIDYVLKSLFLDARSLRKKHDSDSSDAIHLNHLLLFGSTRPRPTFDREHIVFAPLVLPVLP